MINNIKDDPFLCYTGKMGSWLLLTANPPDIFCEINDRN